MRKTNLEPCRSDQKRKTATFRLRLCSGTKKDTAPFGTAFLLRRAAGRPGPLKCTVEAFVQPVDPARYTFDRAHDLHSLLVHALRGRERFGDMGLIVRQIELRLVALFRGLLDQLIHFPEHTGGRRKDRPGESNLYRHSTSPVAATPSHSAATRILALRVSHAMVCHMNWRSIRRVEESYQASDLKRA